MEVHVDWFQLLLVVVAVAAGSWLASELMMFLLDTLSMLACFVSYLYRKLRRRK